MDKEELQKNIALYYSKLPPEAQVVFSSMNWLETIKQISARYGLNDKQIETLGTETTLVLLGIIHPEEYEEILRAELRIREESLKLMLEEINRSVLDTIKPQLVETFHSNNELEVGATQLDARFEKLPKEIQDAIVDSNYHAILFSIADGQNLSVPQMGVLEKITTDVMLGVTHPNDFEAVLTRNLDISSEKIKIIVESINEKILKSIRMKMMSLRSTHPEKNIDMNTQINRDEESVLSNAGIEIITPNSAPNTAPANKTPDFSIPEIEAPHHPILSEKLANSFKTPATKTEHSLGNISKTTPTAYPPKGDPYRLSPDE